jgi:ketosteroid isomerase-like protein
MTQQSNWQRLAQAFAGWGKGRPADLHGLLSRDCELIVPESIPYGGTIRGADAVYHWFADDVWRWFDEFTSTPEGYVDAGDRVVVQVRVQATAKNGRTMDVRALWLYEFEHGLLDRLWLYGDSAVIRDTVAGMSPFESDPA